MTMSFRRRTSDKKYERIGLAGLYAFTPFKIVYTKKIGEGISSYILVLATPRGYKGFYNQNFSKIKNDPLKKIINKCEKLRWGEVLAERRVDRYKVHIYDLFTAFEFSVDKSPYVLFIDRDLHDYYAGKKTLEDIQKKFEVKQRFVRGFLLAEFNYESLNSPKICRLGFVLISHRDICPLLDICPESSICRIKTYGHYTDKHGETYGGLFKVYPHIRISVTSSQLMVSKTPALASFDYKGYPLALIHYDDNLSLIAYYVGIIFRSKTRYTSYDYLYVPMSTYWTIGTVIRNTQGLVLTYNNAALQKIIYEIKDNLWIRLKTGCLSYTNISVDDILMGVRINKSVKLWNTLVEILDQLTKGDKTTLDRVLNSKVDQELYEFLIVHTLTHNIVGNLRSELGLSHDDLAYIITKSNKDKNYTWRVYIFEAIPGGYGFIRALSRNRDRIYRLVSESINVFRNINQSFRERCIGTISDTAIESLVNELSMYCKDLSQDKSSYVPLKKTCVHLNGMIEGLSKLLKDYNLWLHPYTIRYVLVNTIPGLYEELFSKFIDKVLTIFNSFDGNIGCGFLEEGCFYGPFIEPLTISYSVLEHVALNRDKFDMVEKIRNIVLAWLETVSGDVRVMTSNMSKEGRVYEKLENLTKKYGIKTYVLLGKSAVNDDVTKRAVNELRNLLGQNLSVKIHERLHDKAIIIDDIALITGSFNLTAAGLNENIESLEVITNPVKIREKIERFNRLWNESLEYYP